MRKPSTEGQDLSPGQLAALRLVASGYTSRQIATRLGTTEQGVHLRMKEACVRLGARSRTHAVVIALRRHIIHFEGLELNEPRQAARPPGPHSETDISDIATGGQDRSPPARLSAGYRRTPPLNSQKPAGDRGSQSHQAPRHAADACHSPRAQAAEAAPDSENRAAQSQTLPLARALSRAGPQEGQVGGPGPAHVQATAGPVSWTPPHTT